MSELRPLLLGSGPDWDGDTGQCSCPSTGHPPGRPGPSNPWPQDGHPRTCGAALVTERRTASCPARSCRRSARLSSRSRTASGVSRMAAPSGVSAGRVAGALRWGSRPRRESRGEEAAPAGGQRPGTHARTATLQPRDLRHTGGERGTSLLQTCLRSPRSTSGPPRTWVPSRGPAHRTSSRPAPHSPPPPPPGASPRPLARARSDWPSEARTLPPTPRARPIRRSDWPSEARTLPERYSTFQSSSFNFGGGDRPLIGQRHGAS